MPHKKSKNTMKDAKDTSCAKRGSSKPMTKNFIDIEAGIKKDKEVKEKDVFNFSYKPKANSVKKNPKSVQK
jgi:hypothetical protein